MDEAACSDAPPEGAVGIFWYIGDTLLAAGCPLSEADSYGDCLTYDGGHAEHWDRWQQAGGAWLLQHGMPLEILSSEYDDHPRGRIVKEKTRFIIYCDARIQTRKRISEISNRFGISEFKVRSDHHYITFNYGSHLEKK